MKAMDSDSFLRESKVVLFELPCLANFFDLENIKNGNHNFGLTK